MRIVAGGDDLGRESCAGYGGRGAGQLMRPPPRGGDRTLSLRRRLQAEQHPDAGESHTPPATWEAERLRGGKEKGGARARRTENDRMDALMIGFGIFLTAATLALGALFERLMEADS